MPTSKNNSGQLTFWDHLDQLRGCIVRCLAVALLLGLVVFAFKEPVFSFILAPKDSQFITYIWLSDIAGISLEPFSIDLINTGLAQQFMVHLKVALALGFVLASPYVLFMLFRFVSPALYDNERNATAKFIGFGYIMFLLGIAINYFIIFPLTLRFLGTYQVDTEVRNLISLESYISTLLILSLLMGCMFEMPALSWLLAKIGILKAEFMRRYRRHAFVAILVIAAVITPTADIFTLSVVAIPLYLLYEFSIFIVKVTRN